MNADTYFYRRTALAKGVGFIIGLIGFFLVPALVPGEGLWLRIGILLWYTTVGAMIGVLGLFDHHPFFGFPMPFWFRGIVFGGWANLLLVFLMHDRLSVIMQRLEGPLAVFGNPLWIVAEGAVVGLIVDAAATAVTGDGMPPSASSGV
jgi:hypothetical protein